LNGKTDSTVTITLKNDKHNKLLYELKLRNKSKLGKKFLRQRKFYELVSAKIKEQFNLRKFHVQSFLNVESEILLVVITYNILRWNGVKNKLKMAS
jgi:hypothetical protein